MNKILYITIICLLQLYAFGVINYDAEYTYNIPLIDGDISSDWADATVIALSYPGIVTSPNEGSLTGDVPDNYLDLSGEIYLKWDFNNLYFATRVYDENLQFTEYAPGPFNAQDVIQMCFNLLNNPSAVFAADAPIYDFAVSDANDNGPYVYKHTGALYRLLNAELGGQILSDGYIIEARIPWSDFDYSPNPGDVHGIGFILVDKDLGGVETYMYDYGSGGGINIVSSWNTVTLLRGECGLWGVPAMDINKDCSVDMIDFSILASTWLGCTEPTDPDCTDLR